MENLIVTQKLTFENYVTSGFPARIAANFGYEHLLKREHARWEKYNPEVFITEANPKFNYGLDFKVFLRYRADGILFLREISYGSSCLSNSALREASSFLFGMTPDNMEEKIEALQKMFGVSREMIMSINIGSQGYAKCEANRKVFRTTLNYKTFM